MEISNYYFTLTLAVRPKRVKFCIGIAKVINYYIVDMRLLGQTIRNYDVDLHERFLIPVIDSYFHIIYIYIYSFSFISSLLNIEKLVTFFLH